MHQLADLLLVKLDEFEGCNTERSNFVDVYAPRPVGVTDLCYWCAARRHCLPEELIGADLGEVDRVHVYCGSCGTTSWVPDEGWIL